MIPLFEYSSRAISECCDCESRQRILLHLGREALAENAYWVLAKAGIRKICLHDARHTFGSLLIQSGATLAYVKEPMGYSSIQVTVDIYGHLIPGADISFVDRLDVGCQTEDQTTPQKNANQAQMALSRADGISPEVIDSIGGGGRTRTCDLRIMRPSL
jgi:hypothetical protein